MNSEKNLFFKQEFVEKYDDAIKKQKWYGSEILFGMIDEFMKANDTILDIGIGTGLSEKEFNKAGLEATGIACHIGHAEQREALVAKTIEKYGRIDILVNNAAINPFYGPLESSGEEVFDKIINVNVKAPWLLSNLVQPHMKAQGSGNIINISSVEGLHPGFRLGLYSMTKSALIMLTKNQAKEWGRYGIRSNVVCPGLIKTKFSESLWSDEKLAAGYNQMVPLKRMAEPDEMAGVVMLLASDAGSYMTGGVYAVDGGYLISG